ncbi:MAG: IS4 family transposase [Candidatus Sumerlaeota bacterium]|nr:IS4 family transposase [Candidatus Sumerlaeota bacterium]
MSARRGGAGSFSPSRVFWLFLSQVLSADRGCREALRQFLGWLALEGKTASSRTAAYCRARRRLRQQDLDETHERLVHQVRAGHLRRGLWFGRPVKVADGSGLSMPDTTQNQRAYPQAHGAKPGCSFPVMRVVAIFCLGTGVLIQIAKGALEVSERALFRSLWTLLEAGDVILTDRGFCGYAEFYFLLRRGVDCVMRNHQRRTVGLSLVQVLGPGDRLIRWHKSKSGPVWPDQATWAALPQTLTLREIQFQVAVRGFRAETITVVTTLLDPDQFPADAFADLYRRRWSAELFLRDIKTTMGMDILRCKTPEMVDKELAIYLIAYNLVRLTMCEAAQKHNAPVERLSFKGTLSTIRSWAPIFAAVGATRRRALWTSLLHYLAADRLPHRPNRLEPRARKRRPKNYQLLNKPRRLFKEIHHRNKYTKVLS